MKKIFLTSCFIFLLTLPAGASNSSSRNQVIDNTLDCLSKHFKSDSNLNWADVCYTDAAPSAASDNRAQVIDQALNKASQSTSLKHDDSSRPASMEYAANDTDAVTPEVDLALDGTNAPNAKYSEFWYRPFDHENLAVDLGMGAEGYHYWYEEPNFAKTDGYFYGVWGYYTIHMSDLTKTKTINEVIRDSQKLNMFKLDTRFAYGELDYDSNGTGSATNIPDYTFEIRGLTGYDFPFHSSMVVTPYFGIGYRYLNDDSGGHRTTTGHYGYERESNYIYLPIGVDFISSLNQPWSFGFNAEYDVFVGGTQKSHLEDVSSGFDTLENDQEKGYGLRGSIKIIRRTPAFDIIFEPFVRYWKIDDSKISAVVYSGALAGYGLEPANSSSETGIKVGIQF